LNDRDPDTGKPTGIFYGMRACFAEKISLVDDAGMQQGLKRVNERLLSCGITSVQEAYAGNKLIRDW
jgi:hypothetical protein